MIVHFLTRPSAPIMPNIERLVAICIEAGHQAETFFRYQDLVDGDLLFILAFDRILPEEFLDKHKQNIVIHASDLPEGKGFSPMSWQIAEGRDTITFTMFDAVKDVDAGQIYFKKHLKLVGNELYEEWKSLQADMQENMVRDFLDAYPNQTPTDQTGETTYYRKRNRGDDEVKLDNTLATAFNTIRVCDPNAFPAWFECEGRKFKIVVSPLDE